MAKRAKTGRPRYYQAIELEYEGRSYLGRFFVEDDWVFVRSGFGDREGGSKQIPSRRLEKIAEMAKDAETVRVASKRLQGLWRGDPRFKKVLDPKRIKAAFADQTTLKRWKEEIGALASLS